MRLASSTRLCRRAARGVAACLTICAVSTFGSELALAHVTATPNANGVSATTVSLTFTHGCGTSPTTSLRVQLPEGTTSVSALNPTGWTSTTTDREIAWTGGSVPNGARGTFGATMTIPGEAGETVYLPTIQGCPTGDELWLDKTADPEADHGAPRIRLVTSVATAIPTTPATTAATTRPSPMVATESPPSQLLATAIVLMLVAAIAIVWSTRKRRSRVSNDEGPPS